MLKQTGLYAESWNVAWRKRNGNTILDNLVTEFNVVPNSKIYWAADPFVFERLGETYIFAELYDYKKRRGTLGYCKLQNNKPTKWKQVIVEDYHLSFPFLFEYKNEVYIMPESSSSESLYIYKAIAFPDKWEKVKDVRENVKYVDTTPFEYNARKVAFTYDINENDSKHLRLLDLENERNDFKIDIDEIDMRRPAGKVFNNNIRPAQNCQEDYGKGLVFYEFEIDEKNGYKETEIKRIFPQDVKLSKSLYLDGMHTYNLSENYEVIDVKTRRFNLINLAFRIVNKFMIRSK